MGDQISWWVELAVKPGQLDNFEALTAEMTDGGPVSDHFDGARFFDPHGASPKSRRDLLRPKRAKPTANKPIRWDSFREGTAIMPQRCYDAQASLGVCCCFVAGRQSYRRRRAAGSSLSRRWAAHRMSITGAFAEHAVVAHKPRWWPWQRDHKYP
jgi:hypothetical protein